VTAPAEGNFAFTKDTNSLWYYDGAAWVASGATGDIEGVTAGVGISGGGTSGTVTVTNSMATEIDAKGDLIAGTGADTFARLAVGANDTVLTADSSTATGLKWATPAAGGGGKVLQVINSTTSTSTSTTSSSFQDTTLTGTITPSSATSKILVLVSQNGCIRYSGNADNAVGLQLVRGATSIIVFDKLLGYQSASGTQIWLSTSTNYLDNPATTSATTYKTQFKSVVSGQTATVQGDSAISTMTLIEIGA
jgi:hypothetical protein